MNRLQTTVLTAFISFFLFSCKSKKEVVSAVKVESQPIDCNGLSFSVDIKPILEVNCTNCHNTNNKAGFNFLTYTSTKKAAVSGQLLGSINHSLDFSTMPPSGEKLDQKLIDKINCWINNGMKE